MVKDKESTRLARGNLTVLLAWLLLQSSASGEQPVKQGRKQRHSATSMPVSNASKAVFVPQSQNASLPAPRSSSTLNIDGTPAQVKLFGTEYRGLRLTHVGAKGIAATAGLKSGDILLSLNGHNVSTPESADELLNKLPSGELDFAYFREENGKPLIDESRLRYINPFKQYGSDAYVQPPSPHW